MTYIWLPCLMLSVYLSALTYLAAYRWVVLYLITSCWLFTTGLFLFDWSEVTKSVYWALALAFWVGMPFLKVWQARSLKREEEEVRRLRSKRWYPEENDRCER